MVLLARASDCYIRSFWLAEVARGARSGNDVRRTVALVPECHYNFISLLLRTLHHPRKQAQDNGDRSRCKKHIAGTQWSSTGRSGFKATAFFNNLQPIGVGTRMWVPGWTRLGALSSGDVVTWDPRHTKCSHSEVRLGPDKGPSRTSCPWPEAVGDGANVEMS